MSYLCSESGWIKGDHGMFKRYYRRASGAKRGRSSAAVVSFEDWDGPEAEQIKAAQEAIAKQSLEFEGLYERQRGIVTHVVLSLKANGLNKDEVAAFFARVVDAKY